MTSALMRSVDWAFRLFRRDRPEPRAETPSPVGQTFPPNDALRGFSPPPRLDSIAPLCVWTSPSSVSSVSLRRPSRVRGSVRRRPSRRLTDALRRLVARRLGAEPLSVEAVRRRVLAVGLSHWETPLEVRVSALGREGDGGSEAPTLLADPLLSPTSFHGPTRREARVGCAVRCRERRAATHEAEARRLARCVWDVAALVQRGRGSLLEEQGVRGSLLRYAETDADRRVRAVYEGVMDAFCRGAVRAAVTSSLHQIQGATTRAMERWLMRGVTFAVSNATGSVVVTARGIGRHIRQEKCAELRAITPDVDDETVRGALLRQSDCTQTAFTLQNGLTLTYAQLATLGPGQWLNDQVINAYLHLLCDASRLESGREVAISLGSHFFARVEQELGRGISSAAPLAASSGVLRWFRRRRHILHPPTSPAMNYEDQCNSNKDKEEHMTDNTHAGVRVVLVPINLAQSHWALAVLDWERRTWVYYDSCIGISNTSSVAALRGRTILQQLAHTFHEARRLLTEPKEGAPHDSIDGTKPVRCRLVIAKGGNGPCAEARGFETAPQQSNSFDCGVFVCQTAWCVVQGVATDFTQEDVTALRRVMLHELMCGQMLRRLPVSAFSVN